MRDLRLIGVHDDGEHLVVTDDSSGEEFRLRIDEPLRAAARRDRPRLGQLQIAIDNNVRPREVQAMIRAGATADEVSARTGWDLDKISRFEGPVLAEREHVAERAQTVRMRGTNQAGAPETLAQRAATRLKDRGVSPSDVQWDARRDAEGQWTVSASFTAGGRERQAIWWFDMAGMSVVAKNDEAKWLSEMDSPAGPLPAAVHRPTAVFDVEMEESRSERAHRADPDDLIASMREHSGAKSRRRGSKRRRPADNSAPIEDALPLETEERPPAARGTHPKDVAAAAAPTDTDTVTEAEPTSPAPEAAEPVGAESETDTAADTTAAATPEPAREQAPSQRQSTPATTSPAADTTESTPKQTEPEPRQTEPETASEDQSSDDGTAEREESAPVEHDKGGSQSKGARGRARKGRASVPSWDDVMFGTTRD